MTATPTLDAAGPRPRRRRCGRADDAGTPSRGSGLGWVFTAFFGVFGWAIGLAKLTDNSFFWHLRTGEYILDHGIPHHDVFSYTAPGTKWVAQSWLAEVDVRAAVPQRRRRSASGCSSVWSAPASACSRTASRCGSCATGCVACGLTAAALAGIYTVWSERPLLVGVLFLLVLLWVVEVPDSIVGRHPLVVDPGADVAVGQHPRHVRSSASRTSGCTCSAAGSTARRRGSAASGACSSAPLIAFAAVFVNPYGVELVTFPIDLLSRGDILSHIVEWQSPDFRQAWGIALAHLDRRVRRRAGARVATA